MAKGQTCNGDFSKVVYTQNFGINNFNFDTQKGEISSANLGFKSQPYTQSVNAGFEAQKYWITNDAALLSNELILGADHTQNGNQTTEKGNFLIFKAADEAGTFYNYPIPSAVCENKDYRFSIWVTNALKESSENQIPSIQIQIFNAENHTLISESAILEIPKSTEKFIWTNFSVDFKIPVNCKQIQVEIQNKSTTPQTYLAFDDFQLQECTYPALKITANKTAFCVGETISFSAPNLELNPVALQWQHEINQIWTDIPNASQNTLVIPNINIQTPLKYRLKFASNTAALATDCAFTTENVTVKILQPEVKLGNDTTVCKSIVITAISNDAQKFQWFKNNEIISDAGASLSVIESGTYKVIITNSLGCIASDEMKITVLPTPQLEIPKEVYFCPGDQAVVTPVIPNAQNLTLEWFRNQVKIHEGLLFTTAQEGTYELKATNTEGCSTTFPFKIITSRPPVLTAEMLNYEVCINSAQILKVNPDNAVKFEWFKNNEKIPNAILGSILAQGAGDYSVIGYNEHGCKSNTLHFSITDLPIPTNLIRVKNQVESSPNVFEICEGENIQAEAVSNARNIQWFKEGTDTPISQTSDVLINESGTYTAVAASEIGCSTPKSIQVIIHPLPKVTIEGPKEFCEGSSTAIKAILNTPNTNVSYRWYRLVGESYQVMNETTPEIIIRNSGTYKVTTINNKGCISEETVTINSNPRPYASFAQDSLILYDNSDIHFRENVQFPGDKTTLKYIWEFGDGTTSNEPNPTHHYPPNAPGQTKNYNVKLTVISPKGCAHSTSNTIMVHNSERPIGRFNYELPPCGGKDVKFFDNSIPAKSGGNVVAWLWDFGDGATSTEKNPIHTFKNDGEHIIKLRTTDEINGISPITSLSTIKIYLNPTPKANMADMVNTCLNQPLIVRNISTINFGYISKWIWDFGDGTVITRTDGGAVSHFFDSPGEKTITLRVESPQVCFSTIQKNVTINPLPEVNFNIPDTVCMNEIFPIDSIQNDNTVKWIWDFGDGSENVEKNNDQTFTHKYTRAGKKTISLRAMNKLGCFNLIEKTIEVSVIPVANFKVSKQILCLGEAIHIDEIAKNDIISWAWESSEGNIENQKADAFDITFKTIGTHFIRLTVVNTIGCPDTFEIPITITAIPQAKFKVENKFWMVNEPVIMTDESTVEDGNWDLINYNWNMGNGGVLFGKQSPAYAYPKSGDYTVTLLTQNKEGCGTKFQQSFTVYDYPKADFNPLESNICANGTLSVTDQSFIGNNTVTKIEWYFDYTEGATPNIIDNQPELGKTYQQSFNYQLDAPKEIVIRLVIFSKTGHRSVQEKMVTIQPLPKIIFNKIPDLCYLSGTYQITEAKEVLGLKGKFIFKGKGVTNEGLINPVQMGLGKHEITYTFVSEYGCVTTVSQLVTILPSPTITVPNKIEVFENEPFTVHPEVLGNVSSVQWLPTAGISDPFILSPSITLSQDQTFQLTVVNDLGCQTTVPVHVTVFKEIKAPSAFSPNGDGINDVWNIPNLQKYSERALLQIFNRQGQLLYEKQGYDIPWDGKSNGQTLPVGTYFYRITKFMGNKELTGSVTIVK